MKKVLIAVLCILALAFSVTADDGVCTPTGAEYKDYSDWVDLGNATSEGTHCAYSWDEITAGGSYGNHDQGDTIDTNDLGETALTDKDMRVVLKGSTECASAPDAYTYSRFILVPTSGDVVDTLELRALDGSSGTDSFDVYVNGHRPENKIAHFGDDGTGSTNVTIDSTKCYTGGDGTWCTLSISLASLSEQARSEPLAISISPTEPGWAYCPDWGQVTMSWAGIKKEFEDNNVPEFSAVAAGLALAGAATGFVLLRKRK